MASTPSSKKNNPLNVGYLSRQLEQFTKQYNIKTWCLAYSGGVDSQVLLHLLHLLQLKSSLNITAVYIDHGLQVQSSDWAEHCEQQCQQFNIPFQLIKVNAQALKGEGPEAAARSARYSALKTLIKADSCLLTAQHMDDQAETVLLQLLRGGGAAGLSGMPEIAAFGEGWHARPLLNISQSDILSYAQICNLSWVEDPSNQQVDYDRNYLRHNVIPAVQQRWPSLNKTLAIFARQQAENTRLLELLAEKDIEASRIKKNGLKLNVLNQLEDARIRNALRYWLKCNDIPAPSRAVLAQILQQSKSSSHDSAALISWAGYEVRRFRSQLFCLKQLSHDASQVYNWNMNDVLDLPTIEKNIQFRKIQTDDKEIKFVLDENKLTHKITLGFRQGGEKIKPAGRNGTHDLKSLFQEAAVPSWERNRIPLLYSGDELVAVVGYWLADDFSAKGEGLLPVLLTN